MANIYGREDEVQVIGGGYGGGYGLGGGGGLGGVGALIALVVVVAVLWFLGREGRDNNCGNGGYPGMPYPYPAYPPYGGNCGNPLDCKIPMAIDMSNCEVDKDLWKVDADVWKSACETQKVVTDGDTAILNKLCDQELKRVYDELAQERSKNTVAENKAFTAGLFGQLENMIYKMDNQNDKQIAGLAGMIKDLKCDFDCNIPKRPPVWCEGITPNTHHTDCHDFPRRNCGCNDGCSNY